MCLGVTAPSLKHLLATGRNRKNPRMSPEAAPPSARICLATEDKSKVEDGHRGPFKGPIYMPLYLGVSKNLGGPNLGTLYEASS